MDSATTTGVCVINRGMSPTYNMVRVLVELTEADARALIDEAAARADLYAATARAVAEPVAAAIQAGVDDGSISLP
tara:strand:- start:831 stop:1058 length:228 start_codon:yes stop_codon:yes gene_type:complete